MISIIWCIDAGVGNSFCLPRTCIEEAKVMISFAGSDQEVIDCIKKNLPHNCKSIIYNAATTTAENCLKSIASPDMQLVSEVNSKLMLLNAAADSDQLPVFIYCQMTSTGISDEYLLRLPLTNLFHHYCFSSLCRIVKSLNSVSLSLRKNLFLMTAL